MQYATFPIADHYPDYLSHAMITKYLDDFVDHFGFRWRIHFRTEVIRVEPAATGGWDVTTRQQDSGTERTGRYFAVLVANGHHWDPRYPEPAIPGARGFTGQQLHSHHYRTPDPFTGKRVLVLGSGNSACDIAAECPQAADRTMLAMRRGAHILPKYLLGRPTDHLTLMRFGTKAPRCLQRSAVALMVRMARGRITDYGLPEPDHPILSTPPTISDSLLSRLGRGDIAVKPSVERFDGGTVHFKDGTAEEVDAIIYCTGYKISFPFLDQMAINAIDDRVALYRRVVPAKLPGLYFIGLVQPIGATMPIAEIQSEWVADLIEGRATLPSEPRMRREIDTYRAATEKRYSGSTAHPIQVDFLAYLHQIRRERSAGARRAWLATHRRRTELRAKTFASAVTPRLSWWLQRTSPSQDQRGMLMPSGTSSAESG
jgi:cation diffusion facilitator CzcD-associated flavoprotein CzcO